MDFNFGGLKGLLGLNALKMFLGIDTETLTELKDIASKLFDDEAALRARVTAGLEGAALLAELTPGKTDDKVVEDIHKILDTPLLDTLTNLVDQLINRGFNAQSMQVMEAEYQSQFAAQGISWVLVMELAKLLAEILINSRS